MKGDDVSRVLVVCRCEEVTLDEIIDAIKRGARSVREIKKLTRAGMGLCQGKTCQLIVAKILAEALGVSISDVELDTPRPPLRPIPLNSLRKEV